MKYVWEESDFLGDGSAVGTIIYRPTNPKEMWIAAYEGGMRAAEPRYRLCSLNDGMLTAPQNAKNFAETLNEAGYAPLEDRIVGSRDLLKTRPWIR